MKPPFAYYGGKTTLAEKIVATFPPHRHYVEPFAGSLAVLLAKPPSVMETISDLDGELVTFWRVLRDRTAELARVCALTPYARGEYHAAYKAADGDDELETARRVWVQLTQGRGGTRRSTGWRYYINPAGCSTSMPGYLHGYLDRFAPAAERLHYVSLESRPALELIDAFGSCADVLLYVDPPYLGSTRTSRQYRHEMSGDDEHLQLAAALHACAATVVLSGYPSPLYAELFADWHTTAMPAYTGQAGDRGQGQRTEMLWTNRAHQLDLFSEGEAA